MRAEEHKPQRLSGTISDLPLRDPVDVDDASIKGGAADGATTNEVISPRDPATGLPTGKRR